MAGIYIHIPFCHQICSYCDFYRILDRKYQFPFTEALLKEMKIRAGYIAGEQVDTIYLGGGTPSVLPLSYTARIVERLHSLFPVSDDAEVSIEVNPDDVDASFLTDMLGLGFNRISIGVQSLYDSHLRMLNRRHDAESAVRAVMLAREKGFGNVTADLIYGLPGMSDAEWKRQLDRIFDLDIDHLSAYHLTIEEGTAMADRIREGSLAESDEEESNNQFYSLINTARERGFIHYEISNFCRPGMYSRHNRSYWQQVPYLGLGPSAHSFNGHSRQWNPSDLHAYLHGLSNDKPAFEVEELDDRMRFNEYIMTSLRTMWGVDLDYVGEEFGRESHDYVLNLSVRFLSYGMMRREKNSLILTDQGVMIADNIIGSFIVV